MRFVLATANPGKIREMREILAEFDIEVVDRKEIGIDIDIEETGSTFLENATLKARAICIASGLPAIADDSGLVVDALNGGPGVYSSSYGGENLTDSERCEYLLEIMKGKKQRSAKFVCIVVCMFPDGSLITAEGECLGEITAKPQGYYGFGYDPIFRVGGTDRTMAEMHPHEKNFLSHRNEALRNLAIQISL